jgi:hypothetical protein
MEAMQEATAEWYRQAFADCTSIDPDTIFHAMNTGGDRELKEWKCSVQSA